jgi:hypothetical protein
MKTAPHFGNIQSSGGGPYSEVTVAVLPSSLRTSHSFALVFSTRIPVSVCGTVIIYLSLEVFLDRLLARIYRPEDLNFVCFDSMCSPDLPKLPIYHQQRKSNNPLLHISYVTPSQHIIVKEY